MRSHLFETMSVPKAVTKLALPTMLGMLVQIIYNMADTVFIGWMNDENQMAAVTLSMPFFTFLMALGGIFGIGGSAYIARLLGVKDFKRVKKTSSFSFYACVVLGIACAIGGIIFMEPILYLLGAKGGTTLAPSYDYSFWILLGSPILMLSFALGQIIRAEGASGISMIGMTIGGVLNIILDPIMIFAMDMGIVGAAIATVLGNVGAVMFYLWYMIFKSKVLSVSPKFMIPDGHELKNILSIGIPASLNSMLMCVSNIILNILAANHNETVLAAVGVVFKINMIPVMILIGMCQGVQPLIGYNYSANNRKRMSSVMKFTGIVASIMAVAFSVAIFFGSDIFVSMIMPLPSIVELASGFLKLMMCSVPFLGILFLFTNVFQAMGKSIPAMILSIARQGFVFIPVVFAADALFGEYGLVCAQPIADLSCVVMSIIMFIIVWEREKKRRGNLPPHSDDVKEEETIETNA